MKTIVPSSRRIAGADRRSIVETVGHRDLEIFQPRTASAGAQSRRPSYGLLLASSAIPSASQRASRDLNLRQIRGSAPMTSAPPRSEEHTSELQSLRHLVCRLL